MFYSPQTGRYYEKITAKRYRTLYDAAQDGNAPKDMVVVYPVQPYIADFRGQKTRCYRYMTDDSFFTIRREL